MTAAGVCTAVGSAASGTGSATGGEGGAGDGTARAPMMEAAVGAGQGDSRSAGAGGVPVTGGATAELAHAAGSVAPSGGVVNGGATPLSCAAWPVARTAAEAVACTGAWGPITMVAGGVDCVPIPVGHDEAVIGGGGRTATEIVLVVGGAGAPGSVG